MKDNRYKSKDSEAIFEAYATQQLDVLGEKQNTEGFHTSVENGKFMKSKYGDENTMYLHDLDNDTEEGYPMLVTFDDGEAAEKVAKKMGGKLSKTRFGTFRIIKDEIEGDDTVELANRDRPSAGPEDGLMGDVEALKRLLDDETRAVMDDEDGTMSRREARETAKDILKQLIDQL